MSELHPARIPLGPEVLVIRDRYEVLSIVNDVMIGLWFVVGSVQMLIRPMIRLTRRLHLRRRGYSDSESGQDF